MVSTYPGRADDGDLRGKSVTAKRIGGGAPPRVVSEFHCIPAGSGKMPPLNRELRVRRFIAIITVILCLAPLGRAADTGVVPEQATFSPGKETKILDPKTGGLG